MSRSTTIVPIAQGPMNTVKSYLLVGERTVIVDTGPPGGAANVMSALVSAGIAPNQVSLILITHTHPDHVANAAELRRLTGAPIAMDASEARFVETDERCPQTPNGIAGKLFQLTPLPHQRFEKFTPDITVDEFFDLRKFGVDADVIRCGGHTPGSLAVFVPTSGELLAIDLLAGGIGIGGICFHGHVIDPPFHEDKAQVLEVVAGLLKLPNLRTIHVCHGGPLLPLAVNKWLQREVTKLNRKARM